MRFMVTKSRTRALEWLGSPSSFPPWQHPTKRRAFEGRSKALVACWIGEDWSQNKELAVQLFSWPVGQINLRFEF